MARYLPLTFFTCTSIPLLYTTAALYDLHTSHRKIHKWIKIATVPTYTHITQYQTLKKGMQYHQPFEWNALFNAHDKNKYFNTLAPTTKLTYSLIALNTSIHALKLISPIHIWQKAFMHIPLSNRRFTLATSVFGHGSITHLAFNMLTLESFMPLVGNDRIFNQSIPHLLAFYLSAGIASSYAQVLSCKIKPTRLAVPFLGASGAIFALMGLFTVQNPDAQFNLFFIPYAISAPKLMGALMAFDAIGVIKGFKYLPLGHAVILI